MDRMRRLTPFLLVLTGGAGGGCIGGCIGSVDEPVIERQGAVGEAMNGFPSAIERLGLMAINRARSDPETVKGPQSASYPARPPVIWSIALNQSARFHANNLELSDVTLMHTSPCTLNADVATSSCSGDPSCACASAVPTSCASCAEVDATNTCGTDPFVRIGYFISGSGVSVTGEVAAAGYANPMAVVDGWMDEASGADGHRMNLTDQGITSNTMGYGHSSGSNCWSTFDISDSGKLAGAQIPKIPTAAVSPAGGAAGTFTFYATWADPALGGPASLNVVIDGTCSVLTRELGTDMLNATYKATATLVAGCHNYWIAAKDAAGAAIAYPTTGAITLSIGGVACSGDSLAPAPAASCSGAGGVTTTGSGGTGGAGAGSGGSGGTGVSGGSGGRGGVGGSSPETDAGAAGGAGGPVGSGGGGMVGGSGGAGNGEQKTDRLGGCACDLAPSDLPSTGAGMALLAALFLRRRRARV
jgi:MYXO-CTERM domain-containing protein